MFRFFICVLFLMNLFCSDLYAEEKSLFLAIERNSYQEIHQLIKNGYDLEKRNKKRNTPLLCAAEQEKWDIFFLLANEGASITASNRQRQNALFLAAGKSDKIVDFLLRRGCNPNKRDKNGDTPFSSAFKRIVQNTSSGEAIQSEGLVALICAGTDLSIKNKQGKDVFDVAKEAGRTEDIDRIISNACKSIYARAPYSIYLSSSNKKCIEEERTARKTVAAKFKNTLNTWFEEKITNEEYLYKLGCYKESIHPGHGMKNFFDIKDKYSIPNAMHFLSSYSCLSSNDMKNQFYKKIKNNLNKFHDMTKTENPDSFYICGLAYTYLGDNYRAIDFFRKASENGSILGKIQYASHLLAGKYTKKNLVEAFNLLSSVAESGYPSASYILSFYFEYGLSGKKNPRQAFLCVRDAATQGHVNAMKRLAHFYRKGIGVEQNDARADYWTECSEFLENSFRKQATRTLLVQHEAGALTSSKNDELFDAISSKKDERIVKLIWLGCDLEARNSRGETPFLYAARCGYWKQARLLLDAGADPNVSCNEGRSALMWAMFGSASFNEAALLARQVTNQKQLDKKGQSILHYAAKGYNLKKIELALELFGDIDHQDNDGNTAFALSSHRNTQLLFALGANPFLGNKFGSDFASKAKWYKKHVDPFDMQRFVPYDFLFAEKDHRQEEELSPKEKNIRHINQGGLIFEEIKKYLADGNDVNKHLPDGTLLLNSSAALRNDKDNTVKFLLKKGANPNNTDFHGQTALFHAAKYGDVQTMSLLLRHNSSVTIRDKFGQTSLFYAASSGYPSKVKLLLEKGADVNARSGFGETPLMWAAFEYRGIAPRGVNPAVKLLLEAGANANSISNAGITALSCALDRNDFETAKALIAAGARIDSSNRHLLEKSLQNRDFITFLLNDGLSPETIVWAEGDKASSTRGKGRIDAPIIYWAAQNGEEELVKLLLVKGANINRKASNGETPLVAAINKNGKKMIKLLIEAGADVTIGRDDGQTPLIRAAKKGLSKIVKMLIAAGAVITPEDFDKFIAQDRNVKILKKRGIYADLESVKRLRPELAEMWGVNQDGTIKEEHLRVDDLDKAASDMSVAELSTFIQGKPFTKEQLNRALHFAAERNSDPNVLKLLVEKGADVNDSDKPQLLGAPDPVIFSAVLGNKVKNVEMLITLGADIHKLDNQDEGTLLHSAASLGYVDIVKVLLRHGCDKNVEDHYGSKAIDNARANKKDEIVKLLSK